MGTIKITLLSTPLKIVGNKTDNYPSKKSIIDILPYVLKIVGNEMSNR